MALKLNERYPNRFGNPSADYPQGSFKNRTTPTSKDGSYLEKDWANDKEGFFQSLLSSAGVTANGSVDKVGASQYFDALMAAIRKTTILADTGTANAYSAANTPALTALPSTGYLQRVNIANANTGASTYAPDGLAARPIYGLALQPLQGGELPVGVAVLMYLVQAGVNSGNGAWIITESLGGAAQVTSGTRSLHAVNAGQVQAQSLTAFTTAGTAPAFTLTPSPAITALAAGQRFRAGFNAAGTTGSNTLNVNGLGAKNLVQYDSTGALVSAIISSGMLSDIEYNGTSWVVLDPLPTQVNSLVGIQGAFKNLAVSATGTSAVVSITADEVMLENSSNAYQTIRSVSVSPSLAALGSNGLDTGTVAASTWYSAWVIWNGTTTAGLLSLSATSPAMPSGYTHKARVGWVRSDGTANKYPLGFYQFGKAARYKVATGTNLANLPLMASGVQGTPSAAPPGYISVPLANFVPSTACKISLILSGYASSAISAPNNSYSGISQSSNSSAPLLITPNSSSPTQITSSCDFVIESTNVYYASTGATCGLTCYGWEDNL